MAQINNYFNYLKGYYEGFPWKKGEIKVSEYRSKKTVEAVQYIDHHSSIEALKELAGDKIKVEDSKVSLYNPNFEVYIEINEGEWIVKDDEDLFVMTDSEFHSAYESEIEIENRVTNDRLMEYIAQLSRQQLNPYGNTLTTDPIYNSYSTYTLNDRYISTTTSRYGLDSDGSLKGDSLCPAQYSDASSSISDRLDNIESAMNQTRDRMDKFIEDYVTPNGN